MTILVTGATGNVGRMLVDELLAAGEGDVRALTVSPRRAALPPGVEVAVGQVGRPETVRPALEGVDRMYLAPSPSTAREVAAMAAEAGVRRIVDLAGEEGGLWHTIEGDVEASGVAWTHLEPGEFMSNALDWADEIRTEGAVRDAHPGAANAPIDMRDIAAVAAAALLSDAHQGKRYALTGPESLTRAQWVAAIGDALGREVPFIELTHEEAIAHKAAHMGEEVARWYVEGRAQLVEHPQRANRTVEEVLGRPATTFAQWARDNVDAFRPS